MNPRKLGAWAGIVGPVLFAAIYAIEGWLRPGYDSFDMYLSELSLGPRGFVGTSTLIAYGASLLLFAWGMAAEFSEGKASRAGPAALGITGVSLLAAGVFVMDPLSTPIAQLSWHGRLHGLGGLCSYAIPIGCFVYSRRFREEPGWQDLASWTLATAAAATALMLGFKVVIWSSLLATGSLRVAGGGLLQRIAFLVWLVWQLAIALRLRRRAGAVV